MTNSEMTKTYYSTVRMMRGGVRKFSRIYKVNAEDLESASHEIFVKACASYTPNFGTKISTWVWENLQTKLANEARRLQLQNFRATPIELDTFGESAFGTIDAGYSQLEVDDLLSKLPERARKLVDLRMVGYTTLEAIQAKLVKKRDTLKDARFLKQWGNKMYRGKLVKLERTTD